MSTEQIKNDIRRWVDTAWNQGDFSLSGLYADGYALHDPSMPGGGLQGVQALRQMIETYRTAFPDMRMAIVEAVGEGDQVAWHWTVDGTHTGPLFGLPPSGRKLHIEGVVITRFDKGKWAHDSLHWNQSLLLGQLTVEPVASR